MEPEQFWGDLDGFFNDHLQYFAFFFSFPFVGVLNHTYISS